MTWQPIETLPDGQEALLYAPYEPHYCVGKFRWREWTVDELVSESSGASGRKRKIYQEKVERDREWDADNWGATHWQPLPEPPKE